MSEERMQGIPIRRFLLDKCENRPNRPCDAYMHEQDDGDYVLYEDANRALQKLREALEEMLRQSDKWNTPCLDKRCKDEHCRAQKQARAALGEAKVKHNYDFSKGVRGKYHSCDRFLNRNYPNHAQAKDGEHWKCTCGKEYEHVCDKAEGCSWTLIGEAK